MACRGQQSPRPGHTSFKGRGVPPRWWSVLKKVFRGAAVPKARAQQPRETGFPTWGVVGAQGRPTGGHHLPRRGHTILGGRGVLLRRWSVLKMGLRRAAVPKARAHQPRGTGSPAEVVIGAQGWPAGGSSPQGPRTPASRDGESRPGGGRCSGRVCGGQQSPRPGHTSLRGR